MSVKSHLTYGASVRPENAVTYSADNEGQKICGVFSETAPLQRSSTPSVVRPCEQSAAESTHAHYSIYRVRFLDISIARALSTTLVALYDNYLKTWFSYRDTAPRVQHFSAFHFLCDELVREGSLPLNHSALLYIEVHLHRRNKVCRVLLH